MSRTTKIILAIIASLVMLCICIGVVAFIALRQAGQTLEQAGTEDPAEVAKIARSIVKYELPAGYYGQVGATFFGFKMAAFIPPENFDGPVIMLMQVPRYFGLSQAEMEQQLQQMLQQETETGKQPIQMQVVDQMDRTIRDQTVTLTINEGTESDGTIMRQMSGVFQGKNGMVLLMIAGEKQHWDQGIADAFIASLH
jgi:hypothetical protein